MSSFKVGSCIICILRVRICKRLLLHSFRFPVGFLLKPTQTNGIPPPKKKRSFSCWFPFTSFQIHIKGVPRLLQKDERCSLAEARRHRGKAHLRKPKYREHAAALQLRSYPQGPRRHGAERSWLAILGEIGFGVWSGYTCFGFKGKSINRKDEAIVAGP